MEIEVKELEYCKLQVSCVADNKEIETKRNEVLKVFKKAPIPGFRKGKTTIKAISNYYKKQIDDSLKKALAEDAIHQSMFEKNFKPLTPPQFTSMMLYPSKFSCEFVIHKKPDFDLQDWKSLQLPLPHQSFSEEDQTQKMLQDLRVKHGERVPFNEDNFIENGDIASISYRAYLDGAERSDLSSSGTEVLTVGTSKLLNFDTNLLGMRKGEVREFDVAVNNSSKPELDGKTVKFVLTLEAAIKIVPCALEDEFAKKLGLENLDSLMAELRQNAFVLIENQKRLAKQSAASQQLVNMHVFNLPDWMPVQEAKYMVNQSKLEWDTLTDQTKENYIAQATKNIKLSLVLEKIRDLEPEAQLSDSELIDIAKNNLSKLINKPFEEVANDLNNFGFLQMLYNRIKDEYTLNFVLKTIKFAD